jgi:hypothetical protein
VSATETGRIRYSAAVIRLMTHMSRALAFVAGTAAVTIANSSMWQVSDALGWPRRILLMVVAITVLVTWLIVAHDLWERASDARGRSALRARRLRRAAGAGGARVPPRAARRATQRVGPRGVDVEHRAHPRDARLGVLGLAAGPGHVARRQPTWKGTGAISPSAPASRSPRSGRAPRRSSAACISTPAKDGGDAEVRSWVRADVAALDGPLHAAVSRWLVERWPFERAIYADRPIA